MVWQYGRPTGEYFELNGHPYQQIVDRDKLTNANFQPWYTF